MMRDEFLMYGNVSSVGYTCESCLSSDHLFEKCPLTQPLFDDTKIIHRSIYSIA